MFWNWPYFISISFTASLGLRSIFLGFSSSFPFLVLRRRGREFHDPYFSNLTKFEEGLTLFFLFSCWVLFLLLPLTFSSPLFSFPSRQLSTLLSRSHLSLTLSPSTLYWFGLGFCWERGREERHAAAGDNFGKRMDHPLSPPCIYTPH